MFYLSFYSIFLPVISIESFTDLLYSSIYLPDIIIYGTCSVYLTVLSIYLFFIFQLFYFLYLFYVSTFYIYLLYLSSPSICQLILYLPDLLHSDKKMSSQIPISPGRTEIMINFYFLAKMRTYTYISNIFPCTYIYIFNDDTYNFAIPFTVYNSLCTLIGYFFIHSLYPSDFTVSHSDPACYISVFQTRYLTVGCTIPVSHLD